MKKILVADNHDSFVYNIVEILRHLDVDYDIVLSDSIDVEILDGYDGFILSPGGGLPSDYPAMSAIVGKYYRKRPILGICLGHQAIAEAFGCRLINLKHPLHGHSTRLVLTSPKDPVFNNLSLPLKVGRYHSWIVDPDALPDCLEVIATDEDGNIMAVRHRQYPVYGFQFHPESIISAECGSGMIENWLAGIR